MLCSEVDLLKFLSNSIGPSTISIAAAISMNEQLLIVYEGYKAQVRDGVAEAVHDLNSLVPGVELNLDTLVY